MTRTVLAWGVYPATMVGAFVVNARLLSVGLPILVAAYASAALAASAVTFFEFVVPYDKAWQPRWANVKNDLLFMVTVQMVLPQLLGLLLALTLLGYLESLALPMAQLWPRESPLFLQVVLMLLVAELLRYPLHVAAHNTKTLWRLHAVHHSPKRLYWLNVGRFHPAEKALQYTLDTLPFILCGVGADVVALYFIFYAVNGFYQHSNVDVRYGPLNYVVSGPELHRWHHSKLIDESNRNYGNNLILWDLVFGTWFLPKHARVGDLGLLNRDYPLGFVDQMTTPLTPGLDKKPPPMLADAILNSALWARMQLLRWTHWRRFVDAAKHPEVEQTRFLLRLLRRNQDTRFGREHAFGSIKSYAEFAEAVPVQTYKLSAPTSTTKSGPASRRSTRSNRSCTRGPAVLLARPS